MKWDHMHRIHVFETYPVAIRISNNYSGTCVSDCPYTLPFVQISAGCTNSCPMVDAAALQLLSAPNGPSPSTMTVYAYSSSAHLYWIHTRPTASHEALVFRHSQMWPLFPSGIHIRYFLYGSIPAPWNALQAFFVRCLPLYMSLHFYTSDRFRYRCFLSENGQPGSDDHTGCTPLHFSFCYIWYRFSRSHLLWSSFWLLPELAAG